MVRTVFGRRLGLGVVFLSLLFLPATAARAQHDAAHDDHDHEPSGRPVEASFRLFGDAGLIYESRPPASNVRDSFTITVLDFFASVQLETRLQVLAEAGVEYEPTTNESAIDLERLWGSYFFNDYLHLKFGREHSPVSRWDRLYHHGKLFWPSATKPFLARFEDEGGPLPIHQVGLEAGGKASTPAGTFNYAIVISNGRGFSPEEVTNSRDRNNSKALQVGGGFSPARWEGLSFGFDLSHDTIPPEPGNPARAGDIDEGIVETYAGFRGKRFDLIGEAALIDHDDRTGGATFRHRSAYVHLTVHTGDFSPYARFDLRRMAQGDPFYQPSDLDLDRWEQVLGVRYDIGDDAALKLEAAHGKGEERDVTSGLVTRHSFTNLALQLVWGF